MAYQLTEHFKNDIALHGLDYVYNEIHNNHLIAFSRYHDVKFEECDKWEQYNRMCYLSCDINKMYLPMITEIMINSFSKIFPLNLQSSDYRRMVFSEGVENFTVWINAKRNNVLMFNERATTDPIQFFKSAKTKITFDVEAVSLNHSDLVTLYEDIVVNDYKEFLDYIRTTDFEYIMIGILSATAKVYGK